MEQEERPSVIKPLVTSTAIAVVVVIVIVLLIGWVLDWNTLYQYGTGLIVGGIIAMVLGLFAVSGGMRATRGFEYQQAQSAGYDTIHDRTVESKQNLAETYSFMIVMGIAGLVSIVIGIVLRVLA